METYILFSIRGSLYEKCGLFSLNKQNYMHEMC